jgi:hypothetical protein
MKATQLSTAIESHAPFRIVDDKITAVVQKSGKGLQIEITLSR